MKENWKQMIALAALVLLVGLLIPLLVVAAMEYSGIAYSAPAWFGSQRQSGLLDVPATPAVSQSQLLPTTVAPVRSDTQNVPGTGNVAPATVPQQPSAASQTGAALKVQQQNVQPGQQASSAPQPGSAPALPQPPAGIVQPGSAPTLPQPPAGIAQPGSAPALPQPPAGIVQPGSAPTLSQPPAGRAQPGLAPQTGAVPMPEQSVAPASPPQGVPSIAPTTP